MIVEDVVSHPRDIAAFAVKCTQCGLGVALIFVISVEGGSVRSPGLRMAIGADGRSVGFVSSGCLEADLITVARDAIGNTNVRKVSYGRGGPIDIVLPCGGRIDLLIVPVTCDHGAILRTIVQAERECGAISLSADGGIAWIVDDADASDADWLFTVRPKIKLLVIGSGHEALFLAGLSAAADMMVEVISPEEGTLAAASQLGLMATPMRGLSSSIELSIDPATAIALMFHDHEWEVRVLQQALVGPAFYIGALGSQRAHRRRVESLLMAGCKSEAIARIKAPVGLVQRLRDPNLLAVSVLAEVTAEFQARFNAF